MNPIPGISLFTYLVFIVFFFVLTLYSFLYTLIVSCNTTTECSDHGTCGDDGKCVCNDDYYGSDCSSKFRFFLLFYWSNITLKIWFYCIKFFIQCHSFFAFFIQLHVKLQPIAMVMEPAEVMAPVNVTVIFLELIVQVSYKDFQFFLDLKVVKQHFFSLY